ncbi:MAG TPA: hypothetical protein VF629_07885 [Hymenobacter sp.]|uniref:PIN domain-containing protein n=1 Tax=Hymenobacter sp. TaxID=1898978 RepID=UPI002ED9B452
MGKSQKDQINASFKRAISSIQFTVKRWVLCIPLEDFDLQENKWWADWKVKQEQAYGIPVQLMNGRELIHKLKLTGLYRQVFQLEDSMKIADLHGAVIGPGALAETSHRTEQQLAQVLALLNAAAQPAAASADVEAMLDIAEQQFIQQYNPRTALRLLTQLGQHLEQRHSENTVLNARYEHLVSAAHQECGEAKLAYPHALRAHRLQEHNRRYAASAALAEASQGNVEKARATAQLLLDTTPAHPVAQAVLVFCQGVPQLEMALAQVPAEAAQAPAFRLALLDLLELIGPATATLLLGSDLSEFPCPQALTFETERYWITVAQLIVQLEVGSVVYKNFTFVPQAPEQGSARLRRAYEVLTHYTQRLEGTEKRTLAGNALFVRGLAGYYLTGKSSEFDDYKAVFFQQPVALQRRFGSLWANLLARWDTPAAVLAVLDVLDSETDPNVDYLRFLQQRALQQADDARVSLARDLSRATVIETTFYTRATLYLMLFCSTTEEREAFVGLCQSRGQLTQELPAMLLRAATLHANEERQAEMVQLVDECEALSQQQPDQQYTLDVAELYHLAKEYEKSMATLQRLPPATDTYVGLVTERLYIDNLHGLSKGSEELRQRLKDWRLNRPAELKYCFWELEIAELLNDTTQLLEVAEYAHAAFPEDGRLYWKYLYALHLLGMKERLRPEIERVIQHPNLLGRPQLFNVAAVAKQAGWHRLALDVLYPLACDRQDIQARDKFIHLSLLSGDEVPAPPTEAAIGTTVVFTVDGQPRPPLALTAAAVDGGQHPFASQLIGLRPGDTFTIPDALRNRKRQGVVQSLLDAHTALFQDIIRQAEEQEGDFSIQTLKFESSSFEELERVLIQQFGTDEQDRQNAIRELLAECAVGESGFSAVARGVCSGNGLEAYQLLTSNESAGFFVAPLTWYEQVELRHDLSYVLDWSSLPLFYQLHQAELLTLPTSLWVAAQVPEFLQELITEKERLPASRMSLSISKSAVRGIPYSDTYKQDELDFLHKLLAWVKQHCQWRLVPEKLDVMREAAREGKDWLTDDKHDYFAGVLDTLFLADQTDTLLVSDDMVFNELLRRKGSVISAEKFLRTFAVEKFDAAILPILLQSRYVGLTIDPETMLRLFISAGGSFRGAALHYLESLPLLVRENPRELLRIHQFLIQLYLMKSLTPAQKSLAAVAVYVHALRHLNLAPELQNIVKNWIRRLFHLLPIHQRQVLRDFDLAWQQLSERRLLL